MHPVLTVEFRAKVGDQEFLEESVPLHSPQEFFDFVSPGGGCDAIPSEVDEIQMMFLPGIATNAENSIADTHATLRMGIVYINGPLEDIVDTASQIIERANSGEISNSFLKVIGAPSL